MCAYIQTHIKQKISERNFVGEAALGLLSMFSLIEQSSSFFFFFFTLFPYTGAISIPLYIPYRMFDWNFGNKTCVFWLIIDYLLCTTSVHNIVLISYDRYQSVSNAVSKNTNFSSLEDYILVNFGFSSKNFF